MPEQEKGKRGGYRPGAGRKPNPSAPTTNELTVLALGRELSVPEMARAHAAIAIVTLSTIAEKGLNEAARVAASRILLEFAHGKPGAVVQKGQPEKDVTEAAHMEEWKIGLRGSHPN